MRIRALLVGTIPILACACGQPSHGRPGQVASSSAHPVAHPSERPPLAAPVRPVVDTYFGVQVTDAYRWMENERSPEYVDWLAAQNTHARALLDRIPARAKMVEEIRATTKDADALIDVQETENGIVFSRKPAGAVAAKLFVRRPETPVDRLIFEPSGEHAMLDSFVASPDGRLVAVLTSAGGTEERTLHVVRIADGQPLPDRIEHLREPNISWSPDSRGFAYTGFPQTQNSDPVARYHHAEVRMHAMGTLPAGDPVVFGGASQGGPPDDEPVVIFAEGSTTALGFIYHGVLREISLYVKPLSEIGRPSPWHEVVGPDAEITDAVIRGNDLYVLSFHGADRGRVLRLHADNPELARAVPIVPETDDILEEIRPARDGFLGWSLRNGVHRLVHVSGSGRRQEAPLPGNLSVEAFQSRGGASSALLRVESYVASPIWMRWDGGGAAPAPLPFNPPPFAFAAKVERTTATSADGTRVPLTLLLPPRAARDGQQYVWLIGYGAGGYTLSPKFFSYRDAWLQRGGVIALAHIRGGGEKGVAWHRAAMIGNKERSTEDFIACAEQLVKEGYTTPRRMVANGRSAGAIVAGGAITRRPDLFRAMVVTSAAANLLRIDTLAAGAENAREYGSTNDQEGFEALRRMDVVQRV
ncbi:MAG TPA: prolyl oligopeptidase family serine peptidase, partial [Polyangiaceae bacterium]|nr:prolyl oligopeptidase family serine peptidase [Polyangiaceae bacterium]